MRTTVAIDTGLWNDARRFAEAKGQTFSELVEEALRARLAAVEAPAPAAPFAPVRFGGDGLRPGITWDALGADDELERFLAAEP